MMYLAKGSVVTAILWLSSSLVAASDFSAPLIFPEKQASGVEALPLPKTARESAEQSSADVQPERRKFVDGKGDMDLLGCILEPSTKVQVSSPVAGVVSQVPVSRGDSVRKGQVLFTLRDGVEAAAVDLARVQAQFAERKHERNRELYQDELLSPHEKDEIETEMQIARMELKLKQQELALRTIYSPVTGVVTDRNFNPGEHVSVDPVVELATLDPLHVDLLLPAKYFGQIEKGNKLLVFPEPPVGGRYPANVTIVDPLVDPASGTFRVQLLLENPGLTLPAGIRCSVSQPQQKTENE